MSCIVVVSRYNPKEGGGLERVVSEQVKILIKLGLRTHVIFRRKERAFMPCVIADVLYAPVIYYRALKRRCDVIIDNFEFTLLVKMLKILLRRPCIVVKVHHGTPHYLDGYSGIKLVFAKLYKLLILAPSWTVSSRLADINIAVSNKVKEELINHYKVPPSKIVTIPNGVDVNTFKLRSKENVRKVLGLPIDKKIALFVGGDLDRKNFWLAFKVVEEVRKYIPNVLFVVVTSRKNRERLRDLKVNWLVVMTDVPTDKMPLIYNSADVLLLPSKYEGFPLTILEALASGCPVITSVNAIEKEYSGKGYLIAHTFKDYVKYCIKLLKDENYWKEVSLKGRNLVASKYNIRKQHEAYAKLILLILRIKDILCPKSRKLGKCND